MHGTLDLCGSSYDTQSHSLFRTLDAAHHKDFHQPSIDDADLSHGGPREPWHDIRFGIDLRAFEHLITPPSPVNFPGSSNDHEAWNVCRSSSPSTASSRRTSRW
ncbi:hypothetical protein E2562_036085 [Oryza meyeriana var. granulata]|uniref:Uncharacterized protein n=1 Tax=Oryza meyeriana var. granulata TaxID=110450 RepID=A0A6G1CX49_9ORYZ|nr:hypothetical protein E2562_036085 [Oryza meyeriana var. granulata]